MHKPKSLSDFMASARLPTGDIPVGAGYETIVARSGIATQLICTDQAIVFDLAPKPTVIYHKL